MSDKDREQKLMKLRDQLAKSGDVCARVALEAYPDWDDLKTLAGELVQLTKVVNTILGEVWRGGTT